MDPIEGSSSQIRGSEHNLVHKLLLLRRKDEALSRCKNFPWSTPPSDQSWPQTKANKRGSPSPPGRDLVVMFSLQMNLLRPLPIPHSPPPSSKTTTAVLPLQRSKATTSPKAAAPAVHSQSQGFPLDVAQFYQWHLWSGKNRAPLPWGLIPRGSPSEQLCSSPSTAVELSHKTVKPLEP